MSSTLGLAPKAIAGSSWLCAEAAADAHVKRHAKVFKDIQAPRDFGFGGHIHRIPGRDGKRLLAGHRFAKGAVMTRPPLPEWAPHQAVWIGFPSHAELWVDDLAPAQAEVTAFAAAVDASGKGEAVWLVAANAEAASRARAAAPFAKVIVEPFGDIWLRDTAAIVLGTGKDRRAVDFAFNGWGGKYSLPGDETIGQRLAAETGLPCARSDWILEGGAIDGDGSGTVVTTEQCLL